jgi:hypothetical protein
VVLENLGEAQLREICRTRLENAERWLRRLVHEQLSKDYPDYLTAHRPDGSRVIKASIAEDAIARRVADPARYPRGVDAFLTDDLVAVVCNPNLYRYFRPALITAYPEGRDEAATFLHRLIAPRNSLAHANMLTLRQAEQVVCYAGDVVDSLKKYYQDLGMADEYNVPTIFRVSDSLGNSFERSQLRTVHDGGIGMFLSDKVALRPGDVLTVELEIDPSFDPATYTIRWATINPPLQINTEEPRLVLQITDKMVARDWNLQAYVTTNRSWHRMHLGADDFLAISYRVLPPV